MQSDLIGAIYDAPLAAQPWAELTGRLRRALDCSGTMFKFARSHARDGRTRFVYDAAWDSRESWPPTESPLPSPAITFSLNSTAGVRESPL